MAFSILSAYWIVAVLLFLAVFGFLAYFIYKKFFKSKSTGQVMQDPGPQGGFGGGGGQMLQQPPDGMTTQQKMGGTIQNIGNSAQDKLSQLMAMKEKLSKKGEAGEAKGDATSAMGKPASSTISKRPMIKPQRNVVARPGIVARKPAPKTFKRKASRKTMSPRKKTVKRRSSARRSKRRR